ncbi:hypothetical protein CRYUN_Cryun28dG0114300 [Craigia yunnanensis]
MTPVSSPMKKAIASMQGYWEVVGHFTKLDPQEAWLPITESRNGNAYYSAFHTMSLGIGFQALLLPLAFITLGCCMNQNLGCGTADTSDFPWQLLEYLRDLDHDRRWDHEDILLGRPETVSYEPPEVKSEAPRLFSIFNALGIIACAFKGHNLVLEIQGTMPSSGKHPSRLPTWRGVKFAYLIVATCLFPLAIGCYWVYGNLMPEME